MSPSKLDNKFILVSKFGLYFVKEVSEIWFYFNSKKKTPTQQRGVFQDRQYQVDAAIV